MNLWRKLEAAIKPWMIVLVFVILLLFGFYKEASAEVTVELGPTFLSGEYSKSAALAIHETINDKWRVGMGVTGTQRVKDRAGDVYHPRANLFVHGQRIVRITQNTRFGIGVAYFNAKTRWNGSNFLASLSIEYRFNPNWDVKYRHFSNAGSAPPNMGQDIFLIGYTF